MYSLNQNNVKLLLQRSFIVQTSWCGKWMGRKRQRPCKDGKRRKWGEKERSKIKGKREEVDIYFTYAQLEPGRRLAKAGPGSISSHFVAIYP